LKPIIKYILISTCRFSITCCNTGYELKENEVLYKDWNEGGGYFYKSLSEVNIHSFKVLKHSSYAKDKNQAYYRGKLIKRADAKTFQTIADEYAVDGFSAFYQNKKIDSADGRSFELLDNGPYGKDQNDYYYYQTKMNVSEVSSFKVLDESW